MTLLGNFVEMSGQGEHDPFIENKRSERSMRGEKEHPHQEGNGSRTAFHAVHAVYTPPREAFFALFSCPDKISQQSHSYTRFLSDGDIHFPTTAAHTLGATTQALLLQGDMLAKPRIRQYIGGNTC